MSVTFQVPSSARFFPTVSKFVSAFNDNDLGQYDFDNLSNKDVFVMKLLPGTVYIIDRMSVGGSISEVVFNSSINEIPLLELHTKYTKERIYKNNFPIVNFIDDQDVTAWIDSIKSKKTRLNEPDELLADLSGILNQISETVGISSIELYVSFSIYAMDSSSYNQWKRQRDSASMGSDLVGGVS